RPRWHLISALPCSISSQTVRHLTEGRLPQTRNAHNVLVKTLADPTRRALFERLCREEDQTVRALTARAGVSQLAVSKHLALLKRAGVVRDPHEGRACTTALSLAPWP